MTTFQDVGAAASREADEDGAAGLEFWRERAQQLQHALDSRIVIEQAKGVVSFTRNVPIDQAFDLIRAYARRNRQTLSSVAARLVRRELTLEDE